ncbi:MAG: site-specific integrase [archaeon]
MTPHVLRHTYGTMIARKGASPQYIRQTMGHADLSSASTHLQYTGQQLDAEAGK